jgi:hypothetical protein
VFACVSVCECVCVSVSACNRVRRQYHALFLPHSFTQVCHEISQYVSFDVRAQLVELHDGALTASEATVTWASQQITRFEWLYGEVCVCVCVCVCVFCLCLCLCLLL